MCTISLDTKSSQLSMHLEGLWLFTICVGLFIPLSYSWKGPKKVVSHFFYWMFFHCNRPLRLLAPFFLQERQRALQQSIQQAREFEAWSKSDDNRDPVEGEVGISEGICVFVRGKHGGDFEKCPKKRSFKWVSIFGGLADLIWHLLSHHKTLFFLVPKWLFFLQVLDIFRSQHPWPGDLEAVGKMNGFWLCRVSPCSQVCDVYDNVCFRVFRTVALNLPVSDWAYFSGKQKPRAFMSY